MPFRSFLTTPFPAFLTLATLAASQSASRAQTPPPAPAAPPAASAEMPQAKTGNVAATRPARPIDARQIEAYLDVYAKQGRLSGAVLIAQDGQPVVRCAYGYADWDRKTPNTPDTAFTIFSMTKQFTAAAILLLQERGQLDVSDPVARYFSDWPEPWKAVTIQDVVTHTSGVPTTSLFRWLVTTGRCTDTLHHLDALVRKERIRPLESKPGTQYAYSNAGYVLLAALVTKVSGRPYRDFVRDTIFVPLGMTHSGFGDYRDKIPNLARGHALYNGKAAREEQATDMIMGAGDIYSTVDDLLLWDQALDTDKLLSAKSRQLAFTPHKEGYGYGWIAHNEDGTRFYEHTGAGSGFCSLIMRVPAERRTVIVLSNSFNVDFPLFKNMMRAGEGQPVTVPHYATVPTLVLRRYTGVYESPYGRCLVVAAKNALTLLDRDRRFEPLHLLPLSATTFTDDSTESGVRLVTDERGQATRLVWTSANVTARRIDAPLSPAQLARYEGVYALPNDSRAVFRREGSRLVLTVGEDSGVFRFGLLSIGNGQFVAETTLAYLPLTFSKDRSGRVVGVAVRNLDGKISRARKLTPETDWHRQNKRAARNVSRTTRTKSSGKERH